MSTHNNCATLTVCVCENAKWRWYVAYVPCSVLPPGVSVSDGLIKRLFPGQLICRKSGVMATPRRYSCRLSRRSSVELTQTRVVASPSASLYIRLGRLKLQCKARVYILAPSSVLDVLIASRHRDFRDCYRTC